MFRMEQFRGWSLQGGKLRYKKLIQKLMVELVLMKELENQEQFQL